MTKIYNSANKKMKKNKIQTSILNKKIDRELEKDQRK